MKNIINNKNIVARRQDRADELGKKFKLLIEDDYKLCKTDNVQCTAQGKKDDCQLNRKKTNEDCSEHLLFIKSN